MVLPTHDVGRMREIVQRDIIYDYAAFTPGSRAMDDKGNDYIFARAGNTSDALGLVVVTWDNNAYYCDQGSRNYERVTIGPPAQMVSGDWAWCMTYGVTEVRTNASNHAQFAQCYTAGLGVAGTSSSGQRRVDNVILIGPRDSVGTGRSPCFIQWAHLNR